MSILSVPVSRYSRELSGLIKKLDVGLINRVDITVCGKAFAVMISKSEYDSIIKNLNRTELDIQNLKES